MVETRADALTEALEREVRAKVRDSWDTARERAIAEVGERALGYEWMHAAAARSYSTGASVSSAITLAMSSASTLAAAATSQSPSPTPTTLVTCAILGAASTAAAAVARWMDLDAAATRHHLSARAFARLASEIKIQVQVPREDRHHAVEFLEKIVHAYNHTVDDGPPMPSFALSRFKAKVSSEDMDIAVPEIANGHWKIFK